MRWMMELQPVATIPAAGGVFNQEARYALPVGHAVSGVALVDLYRNVSGAALTITILTASHTGVRDDATNTFWLSVGSATTSIGQTGLLRIPIADLGEWVKYIVTGATGGVDFSIKIEFADRKAD